MARSRCSCLEPSSRIRASIAMGCASMLLAVQVNHPLPRASDHNPVRSGVAERAPILRAIGEYPVRRTALVSKNSSRLVVGVSGASGAAYGVRVLDACADLGVESHLIVSKS